MMVLPWWGGAAGQGRDSCSRQLQLRGALLLLMVAAAVPTAALEDSNGCDFTGSGLGHESSGIQPVYLNCASGRVEWQYPRAGLRVILRSPRKDRDFRACIRADQAFAGARLFLEGHRSLIPLYSRDDGRPRELPRCFNSYKGKVALYVEAETPVDAAKLKKQVAAFDYDLQTFAKGAVYDPLEECRPCSDEELLRMYCSADFVARGTIVDVADEARLSRTMVTVKASKLYQQNQIIFRHERHGDDTQNLIHTDGPGLTGKVEVPLQCGARMGEGEFLLMGSLRLGDPILRCAPRFKEWEQIVHKKRSQAHCVLEL
ncbi:unnamed protein product [Meganyctiphanes norvegica]|uniref:Meteorin-like protein n=1 Tax=Meganyctiphanes norvegica TaxID=48144 RepID=A0AAV2QUM2_MEGNR